MPIIRISLTYLLFMQIWETKNLQELIPSHLTTKHPAQIKFYFFRENKFTIGIGARKYVDFYHFFTGKPPLMDSKKFGQKITIRSDLKVINTFSINRHIYIYIFWKRLSVMSDYVKFREINTLSPLPLSYWLSYQMK